MVIKAIRNISLLAAAALLWAAACSKPTDDPTIPDDSAVETEFPIVAWTGIELNYAETKLPAMKDGGFNVYLDWYDTTDEMLQMLDYAENAGVKLIATSKQIVSNTTMEVGKVKNHPALMGYFIDDEPEVNDLSTLGDIIKRIRKVDSEHFCYINLYPNWAWGGADKYTSRLESYAQAVDPIDFVSFDFYPLLEKNGKMYERENWYKNLEDVRQFCRSRKLEFWAFALSLAGNGEDYNHPIPDVAQLRYQQFANLSYGAQGFQYWTYWGIYHSAPTGVYESARKVNAQLQILSRYFKGADVKQVWHTGDTVPYGTRKMTTLPNGIKSLDLGGPAVVSEFTKGNNTYVSILNKNWLKSMSFDIEFNSQAIQYNDQGYKQNVTLSHVILEPGNIIVFLIK